MSEPHQQHESVIDDVEIHVNSEALGALAVFDLTQTELKILLRLVALMEPGGTVMATRDDIATYFGIGPTFVSKVTTKLKSLGLAWRTDINRIQINPNFAFKGTREAWMEAVEALPEDAPQILIPAYEVRPPREVRSRGKRHLRAV